MSMVDEVIRVINRFRVLADQIEHGADSKAEEARDARRDRKPYASDIAQEASVMRSYSSQIRRIVEQEATKLKSLFKEEVEQAESPPPVPSHMDIGAVDFEPLPEGAFKVNTFSNSGIRTTVIDRDQALRLAAFLILGDRSPNAKPAGEA